MRTLFSDGTNSLSHTALGMISVWYSAVAIPFFVYQVVKHTPVSQSIPGVLEYLIGYVFAFFFIDKYNAL
jgi:hypothetical protein